MASVQPGRLAVGLIIITLFLIPVHVSGSWSEIDEILREAYGKQTAKECRDYYSSLDIPEEQLKSVKESISRFVKAGYPSGCPREYLRLAAELSKAGIDLDDLTNKIREGLAKNVSPERLIAVITRRAEVLKEARILTLKLIDQGTEFPDRQMAYTVMADYLLRGVDSQELFSRVADRDLSKFPALENVIQ